MPAEEVQETVDPAPARTRQDPGGPGQMKPSPVTPSQVNPVRYPSETSSPALRHRAVSGVRPFPLKPCSRRKPCGRRGATRKPTRSSASWWTKNPKNPDYQVRWGRLFLEHWQPDDAADLFGEALQLKKDHAGACSAWRWSPPTNFERKAVDWRSKALGSRSQAGRSAGTAGPPRARRQRQAQGRRRSR